MKSLAIFLLEENEIPRNWFTWCVMATMTYILKTQFFQSVKLTVQCQLPTCRQSEQWISLNMSESGGSLYGVRACVVKVGGRTRVRGSLYDEGRVGLEGSDMSYDWPMASWIMVTWGPLWTDRITDRHDWKYYLPATSNFSVRASLLMI